MFIKLIRLNGTPIWLNASFIVTVEPRKGGGSIVVPVGDGLDYEVKEAPEIVLEMLSDAPAPTVVPIPSGDCLAKPPLDATPEPIAAPPAEPEEGTVSVPVENEVKSKAKTRTRAKAKAKSKDDESVKAEASADELTEVKVEEKPAKPKATRKRKTKVAAETSAEAPIEASAETTATEPTVSEPPKAEPENPRAEASAAFAAAAPVETPVPEEKAATLPPLPFDESQLERLRKLTPRSIQRLKNTLAAQFTVCDHETAIQALVQHGIITLAEQGRILWK